MASKLPRYAGLFIWAANAKQAISIGIISQRGEMRNILHFSFLSTMTQVLTQIKTIPSSSQRALPQTTSPQRSEPK
jgi:hypothetical protein